MPLHLIKLCVGIDSVDDLDQFVRERLARYRRAREPEEIAHTTRMMPKRREIVEGGSLYWVIRGHIQARQRLLDIRPFIDAEGIGRCRLILDSTVVPTDWQPRRPFQGWRYLEGKDAPGDFERGRSGDLPQKLRAELAELGLL